MSAHLFGVVASVFVALASPPPIAVAHIHGKVVAIDASRGTFQIHHDPFPAMPMAMTMEVEPKKKSDLRTLHVGEMIDATVDTSVVPWLGTAIHPASPRPAKTP
jgi:Cu/Ag efflux protein CusF